LGAIVYFIVPTDLVPDFLAGIGYGDDASVLFAAISTVRGHIKPAHREATLKIDPEERPAAVIEARE
jgi:uncharacterized membrane protein YkvA (DUF1232 family)